MLDCMTGISPSRIGYPGIKYESFYSLVNGQDQPSMVSEESGFLIGQDQNPRFLQDYPRNFSTTILQWPEALSARGWNGYCSMPDTTRAQGWTPDSCNVANPSKCWDFKPVSDVSMRGTGFELPFSSSGFL